jgi:iron(III) transport system substrate-binding protein
MGANPRRREGLPVVLLLITTLTVAACGGGTDDSSKNLVSADAGIDALVAAATKEG